MKNVKTRQKTLADHPGWSWRSIGVVFRRLDYISSIFHSEATIEIGVL